MKNIYFLASLMLGALVTSAQVPVDFGSKPILNNTAKSHIDNSRGAGSFYLDYEGYDEFNNGGNYQTFVNFLNNRYQSQGANGDFLFAVQTFDSLLLTPDYFNWTPYDYSSHSVTIDSIFYRLHHQNNSGLDDTVKISIIQLAPGTNRPTTTVLWSNMVITSVDLTGHPTSPNSYPTGTLFETPGYTVPAGVRFGIRIDYYGDVTDTFGLIFGYPNDGSTLCGTSTTVFSPTVSAIYPSAYYQAKTGTTASQLFPSTTNQGYWYYDCNSNGTAQWPQENPYQNWSIWTYVTIGPVGVNEISKDGMNLLQNNPNPFSNETVIRYSLQKASKVTIEITDLTGRVISVLDEGYKGAGSFSTSFNAGKLTAGTYFYTLKTDSGTLTNRMVKR